MTVAQRGPTREAVPTAARLRANRLRRRLEFGRDLRAAGFRRAFRARQYVNDEFGARSCKQRKAESAC